MPYIKQEDRKRFELENLAREIKTPGELNYVISMLSKLYAERKGISYTTYNEVMGVLESAKQEFYRRQVVPYEDKKIEENGHI